MSTRALLLTAWLAPAVFGALAFGLGSIDRPGIDLSRCRELQRDEGDELGGDEPRPGEVLIGASLACPTEALEPTALERLASALASETMQVAVAAGGLTAGLVSAVVVLRRVRALRAQQPTARRAFRAALGALVVWLALPLAAAVVLTVALAVAPLRG